MTYVLTMYIGLKNLATASLTTLTMPAWEHLPTRDCQVNAHRLVGEPRSRGEENKPLASNVDRRVPFIHDMLFMINDLPTQELQLH